MMSRSSLLKNLSRPLIQPFAEFFRLEAASGILLLISSVSALALANSNVGIARYFPQVWDSVLAVSVGSMVLTKSLSHWINDGLMALFFLIVGLEIKREVLEGELASVRQAMLPLVAALGGMVIPAGLFWLINRHSPTAGGWGIPMATDIAFALAIVTLLGERVPLALKVFLTALAIVDDLGAVLVIAFFYTLAIDIHYLLGASGVWLVLLLLNRLGVRILSIYLLLGFVLWYLTLKSGIHATLAGVLLAMVIPFRTRLTDPDAVQRQLGSMQQRIQTNTGMPRDLSEELEALSEQIGSPSQQLEHRLHGPVAFLVIPLFAFCNTSLLIDFSTFGQLTNPLAMGIMAGLLLGKPVGILLLSYIAVWFGWASLPVGVSWRQLVGVAVLAGIGFTMSIFVTLLAFKEQPIRQNEAKIAILVASLLAGLLGYVLLRGDKSGLTATPQSSN
ncbi:MULTISPECIES: Na+/H+ antiporter NhaA [unclassified Spirosoma]|uniref:Na+/H+ antiporter NhaA n=1 Tax=unclassified Spirosoma TaxID=2621999 RepID=UPI0009634D33|nr:MULTISPECIES: Na+/H+ antiporter NhaA [unclassified Spirosoma]OJW77829.1 MAG: Na+/H+ antiporter NhaA [Spirosoma sp. 48-14]